MADGTIAGYPPPQPPPPHQAPPPSYDAGYTEVPPVQPPPVYVQQQPVAPQQTVVVTTVSSQRARPVCYGSNPVMVQCPNCKNQVTSKLTYENGLLVWLCVLAIAFLFQLWLGCCLIPLCIDSLKDVRHSCPVCGIHLGLYKRI